MQLRIRETAILIIIGISTWSVWQPSVISLQVGIVTYGLMLWLLERSHYTRLIVWLMALLLGALRISSISTANEHDLESDQHTVGWVVHSVYRTALIESETERLKVQFYPEAPKQGELVAVWHQPFDQHISWRGGIDHQRRATAERLQYRKAKDWVVLSSPQRITQPEQLLDLKHGGVLWALLSGDKSGIDPQIKKQLQQTGTSHLLAISGMHIGLVAGCAYGLVHWVLGWLLLVEGWQNGQLNRWRHRLGLSASMAIAIWYGEQVGWPASAQRATLMVCLFCLGKWFELSFSLWDVLALAGVCIVWVEPSMLHDLGFQLSFAAVIGIGLFGQYAQRYTKKSNPRLVNGLILSVGMTIGATLGTLPLCAWIFQSLPVTGVVANLFATPFLATIAVPLSMLGLMLDVLWSWGSLLCFVVADASVELGVWLLEPCVMEPLPIAFDQWDMVMAVLLMLGISLGRWFWIRIGCGMFLLGLVWLNTPYYPVEKNKDVALIATFLPIGQGDATLLEWEDGEVWLVDGGPFTFDLVPYLRRQGIWQIDKLWLSHPHADHMEGLFPVLEELSVGALIVGRPLEQTDQDTRYSALWELAREKEVPIQIAHTLQSTKNLLNRGVRVLHPHDWKVDTSDRCNEESVVIEISVGEKRLLLMGDVEEDAERELLDDVRKVDVLKVAHHGSRSSSSPDLIALLQPTYSVISVGVNNRFAHPHPETLWTLRDSKILRTDINGTIEIQFTPEKVVTFVDKP